MARNPHSWLADRPHGCSDAAGPPAGEPGREPQEVDRHRGTRDWGKRMVSQAPSGAGRRPWGGGCDNSRSVTGRPTMTNDLPRAADAGSRRGAEAGDGPLRGAQVTRTARPRMGRHESRLELALMARSVPVNQS